MPTISISPDMVEKIMVTLRGSITEERTDEWIDLLLGKVDLPRWIPKWLVRRVLDKLLPSVVLNSIEDLLYKAATR